MELAIDTSTRHATVGLSLQGNTTAELAWRSERNHSVELVPAIQRLLAHARTEMDELTAIYLAIGPGAFSALRVGMSTAIGMAMAREIDLVAIGTLEVEAFPYLRLGSEIRAIVGAGRGRLICGNPARLYLPRGIINNCSNRAARSVDLAECRSS